jgi:archaellum biogenesis ATPase FlaH
MDEYIPQATVSKLASEHPKGTRHQAKIDIALPLLGNGLSQNAVFSILRDKFPEASESEIESVIRWCADKHPSPATPQRPFTPRNVQVASAPQRTPVQQSEWWISGARITPDDMAEASPIRIPPMELDYATLAIGSLYSENDRLNVVCKFTLDKERNKARPYGGGKTLKRDQWLEYFSTNGIPASKAGAWLRMNPCNERGTGEDGSMCDVDIASFRFVLCESDSLPIALQLALYRRFSLPVAAVILSGGDSAHAWVRVEASDLDQYKRIAKRLLETLKPFGFDHANKNASRLSRLPGAHRIIGKTGDGDQRLIWLNPGVSPMTEDGLQRFEDTLAFPAAEDKPLRAIARDAIGRYEWMMANQGKLGVPSGIPELDQISGGWKKGHSIVIAGQTGGCKTTLALHMIIAALKAGYGVALFSLEMDRDEIFDLLMSNQCRVNRNHFNTGGFSQYDIASITESMGPISAMPLFIEDAPLVTADQIRARVMQLKADGRIGMVVVDYVQFVNTAFGRETREQQVAAISHTLRALARESQLPMLVLSQLNDEGKLRESRVISHNANVVLMTEVEGDVLKVIITKGRGIPTGSYTIDFDRRFAKLIPKEVSPSDIPPSRTHADA